MTAAESTQRVRPPARRPSVTLRLTWRTEAGAQEFDATIGFDPRTAQPVEVFYAGGQRVGSDLRAVVQETCILISLHLQRGMAPHEIAHSLSRRPVYGQDEPETVIGALVDAVAAEWRDET